MVQKNALQAWEEKKDFKDKILEDPEVTKLIPKKEIETYCTPDFFVRHVDDIFNRVFSVMMRAVFLDRDGTINVDIGYLESS